MQFDNFDKRIRDSADNHHPPYHEKAWEKMEKLLDEKMPQEKDDRRRFLFFILLLLGIGGGITWAVIKQPWNSGQEPVAVKTTSLNSTEDPVTVPGNNNNNGILPGAKAEKDAEQTIADISADRTEPFSPGSKTVMPPAQTKNEQPQITAPKNELVSQPRQQKTLSALAINKNPEDGKKKFISQPVLPAVVTDKKKAPDITAKTNTDREVSTVEKKAEEKTNAVAVEQIAEKKDAINPIEQKAVNVQSVETNLPEPAQKKDEPVKAETQDKDMPAAGKNISKSKKKNSFFISVSAGPDISAAGTERPGKIQLLTGAGLGYTYKDRLTLRTGFYTARKVYTASPKQYNPPPPFWSYYPYMEKIEADCKVYEIPLLLSYQFGNKSKSNWMATAGISSFLMKEEVYDYYYKPYPTAPVRTYKRTIKDENNHFFSVVTLSAGYQRKFGNKVSLIAEPYLKLPLAGVGYGNVKLNSAGVMMTLALKPFSPGK